MQQKSSNPRVEKMFGGDRIWSLFAVISLWLTYGFVFWKVMGEGGSEDVTLALAIVGGIVLLFNTASIFAMLSHYSKDKDHIYGLDLHYLDVMKQLKG
jgi:ABC-type polysaccharide/polyol phosphate export permease